MSEEFKPFIEKTIKMLPKEAKLLWLSFTGSRTFGWGLKNFDYDIHGVFYYPDWFDYVHYGGNVGGKGLDLNLHNLDHVLYMSFYHPSFETMVNLSNPVYVSDKRIYELFEKYILSNINELFFWRSMVDNQLNWLRGYFHPRTALHTYRVILQPIYFMKYRRIKHNIFEINEELGLGLKGIYICRDLYNEHKRGDKEVEKLVWDEINRLLEIYNEVVHNKAYSSATNWRDSAYREWYEKAKKIIDQFMEEFKKIIGEA